MGNGRDCIYKFVIDAWHLCKRGQQEAARQSLPATSWVLHGTGVDFKKIRKLETEKKKRKKKRQNAE